MSHSLLWHNGVIKEAGAPVFSALDRMRLGDGVFDTMLCVEGRAIQIDRHFKRLQEGAFVLGIALEMTSAAYQAAAHAVLEANEALAGIYALNTIFSRGEGARGLAAPAEAEQKPQMVLRVSPVPAEFSSVNACIAQSVRRNEGSPLSQVKSFNYGDNILALREAQKRGCNEAIMLNNKGFVACASAGNVFIVKDGIISTPLPSDGALNGVARQILIERYPRIMQRSITQDELLQADEVFLTNSIRGACFFRSLEERALYQNTLGLDMSFHIHC